MLRSAFKYSLLDDRWSRVRAEGAASRSGQGAVALPLLAETSNCDIAQRQQLLTIGGLKASRLGSRTWRSSQLCLLADDPLPASPRLASAADARSLHMRWAQSPVSPEPLALPQPAGLSGSPEAVEGSFDWSVFNWYELQMLPDYRLSDASAASAESSAAVGFNATDVKAISAVDSADARPVADARDSTPAAADVAGAAWARALATTGAVGAKIIYAGAQPSFTAGGLQPDQRYFFRVRAAAVAAATAGGKGTAFGPWSLPVAFLTADESDEATGGAGGGDGGLGGSGRGGDGEQEERTIGQGSSVTVSRFDSLRTGVMVAGCTAAAFCACTALTLCAARARGRKRRQQQQRVRMHTPPQVARLSKADNTHVRSPRQSGIGQESSSSGAQTSPFTPIPGWLGCLPRSRGNDKQAATDHCDAFAEAGRERERTAADAVHSSSCAAVSSAGSSRGHGALHVGSPSPSQVVAEQLVMITDAGEDLDDEMALVMARFLADEQRIELKAVIANLRPSFERARLVRGTLDLLGMQHVPVGIGTDGGSEVHEATFFETATYMTPLSSQRISQLEPGRALLYKTFVEAEPHSLTLLCISSLKDAALFLRDNSALCASRLRHVVIMGGVKVRSKDELAAAGCASSAAAMAALAEADAAWASGTGGARAGQRGFPYGGDDSRGARAKPRQVLFADSAHNNMFDVRAAAYVYARLQAIGIPTTVVSRHAAYAVPVPRAIYDHLAQSGSPIGWRLRKVQRDSIEALWRRACAKPGSPERLGLPSRCDKAWFSRTFCDGRGMERTASDPAWDLVTAFNLYDVRASRALSDSRARACSCEVVHALLGVHARQRSIHPSRASGLALVLKS
jgi:hypothetical protein